MTRGKSICNVLKTIRMQVAKAVTIIGISAGLSALSGCAKDAELLVPPVQMEQRNETKLFCCAIGQMPMFPGGQKALMDYLAANIHYSDEMEETCAQGRVVVTFVVEKDGSISETKVVKIVDPAFDKEALRVVSAMPKWIPGSLNGERVRTRYAIPITFRIK